MKVKILKCVNYQVTKNGNTVIMSREEFIKMEGNNI